MSRIIDNNGTVIRTALTQNQNEIDETEEITGLTGLKFHPVDLVKLEAARRIMIVTGSSSIEESLIKQSNYSQRAIELVNAKADGIITQMETAELGTLKAGFDQIKAIRNASNALELMSPIPQDYKDDRWWP